MMMLMQSTKSDLSNSAVKQRKMKTKMSNMPSHLHSLKEGVSAAERRDIDCHNVLTRAKPNQNGQ